VTTRTTATARNENGQISHWVNGSEWKGDSNRFARVDNPATGRTLSKVHLASKADVNAVVSSSRMAFESWRHFSLRKRAEILLGFRELLVRHSGELAKIISSENGKTLADAAGEIERGLEVADFACGIAQLLKGGHSERVAGEVDTRSLRQPIGVVAGITPFNFPAMVPMWMFPIAIACGNSFVLKPSERDPSAAVVLARLFEQAGLPAGVFNVVHGDREAVDALLHHPDVAALSFVGSTPIARYVYETAASQGKRVQALGGAKNHMIVLPDADVAQAADAAVSAAFGSAGQRCMAVSVMVPVGEIADPLITAIAERVERLRVGEGTDPQTDMGPVISAKQVERILSLIESGLSEGARLVVDGRGLRVEGCENGYFLGACLFDHVTANMAIYREEIFGPVLNTVRCSSFDEALELVNANPYGNGAALFTRDGAAANRFEREVEAGMVGINVPIPVPAPFHSFGGWGDSLFGDTHIYGEEGVHFYTRGKVVTSRWTNAKAGADLGFQPAS